MKRPRLGEPSAFGVRERLGEGEADVPFETSVSVKP
jgi:hypothetical protein